MTHLGLRVLQGGGGRLMQGGRLSHRGTDDPLGVARPAKRGSITGLWFIGESACKQGEGTSACRTVESGHQGGLAQGLPGIVGIAPKMPSGMPPLKSGMPPLKSHGSSECSPRLLFSPASPNHSVSPHPE